MSKTRLAVFIILALLHSGSTPQPPMNTRAERLNGVCLAPPLANHN
jgi:hypothetical protein